MSEEMEIRVNFGKPMPIFPLDQVALMPQAVSEMHIFEPRYRAMIGDALDGAGQIALAVFDGPDWREHYEAAPPIRPAVCVGQIIQHEKQPDGRYNIAIHGVCRARVLLELPRDEARLYRLAMLEPVGVSDLDEDALRPARDRFIEILSERPLSDLRNAGSALKHLRNAELPTSAIMELLTVSILHDSERRYYTELHYRLLQEGDAAQRARLIQSELENLAGLLRRAGKQRQVEAPKGCNWN